MQALRDQRHADEEAKQPTKGKKKSKDKSKKAEAKDVSTAAVAKAWRHSQLTADKGNKRCASPACRVNSWASVFRDCFMTLQPAGHACLVTVQKLLADVCVCC